MRKNGQTHNWADYIHETTGTFPNTKYRTLPVLCNHCASVRRDNIVEKCILCDHRLKLGKQPYCVVSCPSGARVVGDIDNPESVVYKLLRKHKAFVLKEEAGTAPNVYYIRQYAGR